MKKIFQFKSVRVKMLFGFSLVLVLVVGLGIYSFLSVSKVNDDTTYLAKEQIPLLVASEKLAFNAAQRVATIRGYVLFGGQEYIDLFHEYTEESQQYHDLILDITNSEEAEELVNKSIDWGYFITEHVINKYENGYNEVAFINLEASVTLAREIMDGFNDLALEREAVFNERAESIIKSGEITLLLSLGVTVLVVIIGILAAIFTSNSISKPIKIVMDRMNSVAGGDLSQKPLETRLVDEIGQLVVATNEMNGSMRTLLGQVSEVSETVSRQSEELTQASNEVSAGSEQIASTMQELASGSETQAHNAGELSNSMGRFTSKIGEANENGRNIQQSSNEVLEMTTNGYQLMEKSTRQMNVINKIVRSAVEEVHNLDHQSQKISELVSVIQAIADQTNLLALNAAIEAARAGEYGQGFTVVADEVRKLAESVSESVTDITGIVTDIQNETKNVTESLANGYGEVEQGTTQIIETGKTFNEISSAVEEMVNSIQTVTDNLTDITRESEQMNSSIQEIAAVSEESAAGAEQTSASAQQTSSAMEEVTASSNDLATLAEELNDSVQKFKL